LILKDLLLLEIHGDIETCKKIGANTILIGNSMSIKADYYLNNLFNAAQIILKLIE
jgi:hypothetical protein